jgi:hypothetical protein
MHGNLIARMGLGCRDAGKGCEDRVRRGIVVARLGKFGLAAFLLAAGTRD